MFSGKQKLEFCRRLDNWQDVATYFDIPADHQRGFAQAVKLMVSGTG